MEFTYHLIERPEPNQSIDDIKNNDIKSSDRGKIIKHYAILCRRVFLRFYAERKHSSC